MRRSLSNLRTLVALSVFVLALAAGCKSSGEKTRAKPPAPKKSPAQIAAEKISYKIPNEVKEERAARVKHVFGEAKTRNIPLLDTGANWAKFDKWPDRFQFMGQEFKAEYGNFGANNQAARVDSRSALDPNTGYYVRYDMIRPNGLPLHSFHCFWSMHGYMKEYGVDWNGQNVFSLQFYPDGNLYSFGQNKPVGGTRRDFYDLNGNKMGSRDDSDFTWAGQKVTRDDFLKNLRELVLGRFPPEA